MLLPGSSSSRSGQKKLNPRLSCTGWRDMSNNTGQYPAERITINNDYAEKVPQHFQKKRERPIATN